MAWSQSDVDALKAAIASGVLSVEYHDRKVVYQSIAEMLRALSLVQHEVSAAAGGTSVKRLNSRKGFDRSCS